MLTNPLPVEVIVQSTLTSVSDGPIRVSVPVAPSTEPVRPPVAVSVTVSLPVPPRIDSNDWNRVVPRAPELGPLIVHALALFGPISRSLALEPISDSIPMKLATPGAVRFARST